MSESRQRLAVRVTLEGPLALADRRPAGEPAALDYLPGARLRGAVAAVLLADGVCPPTHRDGPTHTGAADCPFAALFDGAEAARFGDGRLAEAGELLPATAASCQDVPGFVSSRGGHGVFDTLIDRACWETLAPAGLLYQPRCAHPECDAPAAPLAGSYGVRAVGGRPRYVRLSAPLARQAGQMVSAWRGAGDGGAVQTLPVVVEGYRDPLDPPGTLRPTVFHAEVSAPAGPHANLLREALTRVTRLGGGGSRSLGAVRVEVDDAVETEPVATRLERFRAAFGVRRGQYAKLAPQSVAALEGHYFSLDLRADMLLRVGGWAPTVVVDADLLRAATGVDDASLTLVRAYAAPDWRGGWQAAWGLPRPSELVARRGSCFLFRTADAARWQAALADLEERGLGERTAEGYGAVRVCDPFHLVLREQAV